MDAKSGSCMNSQSVPPAAYSITIIIALSFTHRMVKNRILFFFCFCQLDEQTDKVIQGGPFSPQKRECQNLRLQQMTIQKLSFVGKELCDITIYHMKQMISL